MSITTSTKITMHEGPTVATFGGNLKEGMEFGIIELEIDKIAMTSKTQEINIMMDQSGSMDENCEDGNSKMDQIKHVTNNILRFVAAKCKTGNVSIGLHTFNTTIHKIFDRVCVTDDNIDALLCSTKKIHPEDGTNIEKPLTTLIGLPSQGENIDKNNIFMSDGDANDGMTNPSDLARLVDRGATNYFIGFGLDHNPKLFSSLSNVENSSYYFIDKIEKSGVAYGEILHNILYRAFSGIRLEINNGFLYDWKTNEWRTEIFIGKMSGEMKRTFHILTSAKDLVQIRITGQHVDTGADCEFIIKWNQESADLTKLFYRQRTQELLYKANKLDDKQDTLDTINPDTTVREMKTEMKAFLAEMKEYMKQNNLLDDRLMKNLCDDIVVICRTIGTEYGHMYSCSRQASQGTERLHTTSDTPSAPHKLRRNVTRSTAATIEDDDENEQYIPTNVFEFLENDDEIYDHTMSRPVYTEEQAAVIRSISENDNV